MFGLTLNAYLYKGTNYTGYMDHSTHYPISDGNIEGQFEERPRLELSPWLHYILSAVSKDNPQTTFVSLITH